MTPLAGTALAVLVVAVFVLGVSLAGALLPPSVGYSTPVTLVACLLAGGLLLWRPWQSPVVTNALIVVLGVAGFFLAWALLRFAFPELGVLNSLALVAAGMVAPVLVVQLRRSRRR